MRTFKLYWNLHKWTGLALAAVFLVTATTGVLLLLKKRVAWIQPPTMTGAEGGVDELISTRALLEVVFAQEHPALRTIDDVDRVDFRPGRRVFKVRAARGGTEMQVCAITGAVLRVDTRRSDLIEDIHDGSFFAPFVHDWIMPVAATGLVFLVGTGIWLWLEPGLHRRRRRRRAS